MRAADAEMPRRLDNVSAWQVIASPTEVFRQYDVTVSAERIIP